ncbi:tRNA uridine-5-carboxymethylaminomethyl(34) synthesis GTPase MnmE [Candidatus Pelagibacter sp.]|uniref:tRNA uridine-5-carboxymethylaminomethyl(34) synthesis GTPase MnmE n=1 Tax=Candidatus Pelagibacter sp. TaxID=2024849 RepID=UPI003F877E28
MTIFALSTGNVKSGIAIIRISGNYTREVLNKLTKKNVPSPRIASISKFYNVENNELIDKGIVLWFPQPNSYTGEDLAELHVHGSKAVIAALLSNLSKIKDCRIAEPGEFTRIAFENGKINLLDVEALSDLISSETELQRKQALNFLNGNISKKYQELRDKILKTLANIEAKIDFPEEDLPEDILKNLKNETKEIINIIKSILDDNKVGEKIRDGFKIVIVGPTNAGKSSLLNCLSKREVAIVSEIEGTTRDTIEVSLNLDGYPVLISDTAGLRDTNNIIEKRGVEIALTKAENADLKIILLDAKNPNFKGFFDNIYDENSLIVVNKSDLISNQFDDSLINNLKHTMISAKHELNINTLIGEIKKKLKNKFIVNENILISRERHRSNLEKCIFHLENFLENNSINELDKAAEDLRLATRNLGRVVGDVDVEEVLGKIFNDFCIGK